MGASKNSCNGIDKLDDDQKLQKKPTTSEDSRLVVKHSPKVHEIYKNIGSIKEINIKVSEDDWEGKMFKSGQQKEIALNLLESYSFLITYDANPSICGTLLKRSLAQDTVLGQHLPLSGKWKLREGLLDIMFSKIQFKNPMSFTLNGLEYFFESYSYYFKNLSYVTNGFSHQIKIQVEGERLQGDWNSLIEKYPEAAIKFKKTPEEFLHQVIPYKFATIHKLMEYKGYYKYLDLNSL